MFYFKARNVEPLWQPAGSDFTWDNAEGLFWKSAFFWK